ncbi:MAG TPA: sigma-70 family RNA polymerase sigma factor [Flavobacteriales bacterium]|nr:sigma-70 family RNA polymerase sigma factor [Flavobacteriales bacterium]
MIFGNKHITKLSDEDILQRYLRTDDNAMVGELYNRYARLVFGVGLKYLKNKEESKDVLFMVFEKLLVDLKKYEIKNFKAWLYTYTKNECLMQLRKSKVRTIEKDVFDMQVGETETDKLEAEDKEAVLLSLENHVEELAEEQKRCIKLFYIENKSYSEISSETGLTFNQIKSFIQNGKRNLKMKLSGVRNHE